MEKVLEFPFPIEFKKDQKLVIDGKPYYAKERLNVNVWRFEGKK